MVSSSSRASSSRSRGADRQDPSPNSRLRPPALGAVDRPVDGGSGGESRTSSGSALLGLARSNRSRLVHHRLRPIRATASSISGRIRYPSRMSSRTWKTRDGGDNDRVRRRVLGPQVDDRVHPAFKRCGRLSHSRRSNVVARCGSDPGDLPFVDIWREFGARLVGTDRELVVDDVDDELSCLRDIPQRVLVNPLAASGSDRHCRRRVEKALKKLKGARLRTPERSSLDTQAIGLGATSPFTRSTTSRRSSVLGSINSERAAPSMLTV